MSPLKLFFILLVASFVLAFYVSKKDKKKAAEKKSQQPNQDSTQVVKELTYFCTKDAGYYFSVWPKIKGIERLDYLSFEIAGMTYRDRILLYTGEHVGTLKAEPTNPYDSNAIKVLAEDGYHVGYVPRDMTDEVRKFATLPCRCYFYIGSYYDVEGAHYYSSCYITQKT